MQWMTSTQPVDYPLALTEMEARVASIRDGLSDELGWLLEHPPLYTAGTSANSADLLTPDRFPVYPTGRGGEYTYHGPGQRVCYLMLDLKKRYDTPDIKHFIWCLEECIIRTIASFDIKGERREGRVGIWVVDKDGHENKIAAIGIRIRKWVSFHGIAINLDPDLSHFTGIIPCGISQHGVTSINKEIGYNPGFAHLDEALKSSFRAVFDH